MLRALIVLAALWPGLHASAAPEIGAPAPALKGTLFSGEEFDLARMRGQVVLINFFSSYCKHCAYEIGNVETFLEQNRDRGFAVIVVGVDRPEDRSRVERMVGLYNLKGILLQDLAENGFGSGYRTPTAFLVDRKGIVRSMHWGGKTPLYFRDVVVPVLTEPD